MGRRRVLVVVLAGAAGIGIALLVVLRASLDALGCGSIDPTDAANYSEIGILNDTAHPVTIDECPGTYCQFDQLPVTLRPGDSYADHAACHASGPAMTSWRVRAVDGPVLGYIAVDTPRKTDGLVFRVTRASPDRSVPTPAG